MKSILVIETPTNCIDCPLQADDKACEITETSFISIRANEEILEDCPLVALPDAEVANDYDFEHYANGVCVGWNRYREVILTNSEKRKNNGK